MNSENQNYNEINEQPKAQGEGEEKVGEQLNASSTKKRLSKKAKTAIISGTAALLVVVITLSVLFATGIFSFESPDESLPPMADPADDNYRTFYQIFVGSFSDSNGDTFGDLRGIIDRMDYLNDGDINNGNDLGVQGIWLSPIFKSPSYHKYDAIDYYEIDWRFGDHDDLAELAALCEERNVKLILDLVINHTSNQHEWFLEFKQARMNGDTENKYYDYYSCATSEEEMRPGCNYQKIGGVSCWYECNFTSDMPELNYDNPEVKKEMLDVAKFYLDLGVDGFRFDAVKYIYYNDAPRSIEFWNWYMGELTAYAPDIYCVGECWSGEAEILDYYEAMNCFNFAMSGAEGFAANAAKGRGMATYVKYIELFQDKVQTANPNGIPMQFLSNHDQDRIAGAFILPGYAKMAASLYLLSPGSPFIYYGEEIGIKGSRASENTDANRRLAMIWGDGDKVGNPIGSCYDPSKQITTTVADQLADETSLLTHYARLNNIRQKYPAIARGEYNAVTSKNKNFAGFWVEYGDQVLGIFHNASSTPITIDISSCTGLDGHSFAALLECVGEGRAEYNGTTLIIDGFTSVILQ